jgi:hypothetical protein
VITTPVDLSRDPRRRSTVRSTRTTSALLDLASADWLERFAVEAGAPAARLRGAHL